MKDNKQLIWERFAKENPEFYISSIDGIDYSTKEGQDFFYDSGIEETERFLNRVRKYLNQYEKALEIGCGIGRMTLPHAKLFKEVYGVDISQTMLEKLNLMAKNRGISNIKTFTPDLYWDIPDCFDYIYSHAVFQHIPDFFIIESYIRRISNSLKKEGIAQLHFKTTPETLFHKIREYMPDFLLPKTQRRGIRCISRSPNLLKELFTKNNLKVIDELEETVFILQKI
jgi:cyclopropane fatty-acyl-phospholipid synthase-like methyltransferase